MAKTLIHLTHGLEQPTRAALAFRVASAASQEGHSVTLVLAGNAILFARDVPPPLQDTLGSPRASALRQSYETVVENGVRIYLSDPSPRSRGRGPAQITGGRIEPAIPQMLVKLAAEHDQVFSY